MIKLFVTVTSRSYQDSDNTDIFSNQLIQFYSNNTIVTNQLHTVRRVAPQHRDRNVITLP